jgi:hypothetical protein
MTEKSNVIPFPRKNILPPLPAVPSEDNAKENVANLYRNNIESIIPPLTDFILDQLVAAGFRLDFTSETYLKDLCLVVESLKSLLYKYYAMTYPLQDVADSLFVVDDKIVRYKAKDPSVESVKVAEVTEQFIDDDDFDGYID